MSEQSEELKQIIETTNLLAWAFYRTMGYEVPRDYNFRTAQHPQEQLMWNQACLAQEILNDVDIDEVLEELGIE